MPELSAKQLERQQKKVEKDKRKKQYQDITIQGTNDYSIVSKRSVEKLYSPLSASTPHYFQHFVKKPSRRSPCINRGYWTRMQAIKRSTFQIIQNSLKQNKKIVIINLGAGYDPLAFQYLDPVHVENKEHIGKLSFIDVDYPDLNKIKIQMIKNSPELCEIVGQELPKDFTGVDFKTENYTALSCNLKDIELFQKQLKYLNLDDDNITKIYIAEVSIAYMLPEFADPVINATSKLSNSHFLLLEQILPQGEFQPFARAMLFHFSKLNSPLNSVRTYPTIPRQIERFKQQGYSNIKAQDLFQFWESLPVSTKREIEQVELFDEWEEFVLFGQHYLILHATNTDFQLFQQKSLTDEFQVEKDCVMTFGHTQQPELERKFLSACCDINNENILAHGGSFNNRLNSILSLKQLKVHQHVVSPRMTHTLSPLMENSFLLIGGRNSPKNPLRDCWVLNGSSSGTYEWKQTAELPAPRTRHCAVNIGNEQVLVYGGNFNSAPFLMYSRDNFIELKSDFISKKSSAMAYNGEFGVIIGGMDSNLDFTDTLHTFKVVDNEVKVDLVLSDPLLSRYGAKCGFISQNEIVLAGGVNNLTSLGQENSIIKINLLSKEITKCKIPTEIWTKFPMLVGFDLVDYKNALVLIGGGAVCYSFGSVWNDYPLIIGESKEEPVFKLEEIV